MADSELQPASGASVAPGALDPLEAVEEGVGGARGGEGDRALRSIWGTIPAERREGCDYLTHTVFI